MNLYCLEVVRAYPDYKRPRVSVSVYHFLTIEKANEKRREEKREYYHDFLQQLEEGGEDQDEVPLVIKDIDDVDEDTAREEYFYRDSYMDMSPFSATLYEIHIETDTITSEVIPFPVSSSIEGV